MKTGSCRLGGGLLFVGKIVENPCVCLLGSFPGKSHVVCLAMRADQAAQFLARRLFVVVGEGTIIQVGGERLDINWLERVMFALRHIKKGKDPPFADTSFLSIIADK